MEVKELIEKALDAREKAYAPYSKFRVGAALQCDDGEIYTGCNIENASFGATICAERTAVAKAVSGGKKSFSRIVVAGDSDSYTVPCGICRQVISEFADRDFEVICCDKKGNYKIFRMDEIMPNAFERSSME